MNLIEIIGYVAIGRWLGGRLFDLVKMWKGRGEK